MASGIWCRPDPRAQPVPPPPSLSPPRPQVVAAAKPAPPAPHIRRRHRRHCRSAAGRQRRCRRKCRAGSAECRQHVVRRDGRGPDQRPSRAAARRSRGSAHIAGSHRARFIGRANVNPRVVLRARGDTRLTVRGADGTLYSTGISEAGDSYRCPILPACRWRPAMPGRWMWWWTAWTRARSGQNQQILGHVSLDPQSLVERFNSH